MKIWSVSFELRSYQNIKVFEFLTIEQLMEEIKLRIEEDYLGLFVENIKTKITAGGGPKWPRKSTK